MIKPRFRAALRDGEIDARVIQHPFGVIAFLHTGRLAEERVVELDRCFNRIDGNVNMEAFHRNYLSFFKPNKPIAGIKYTFSAI